jgi:TetR/AcrR family fatty acid metabolism transcriptional regulator
MKNLNLKNSVVNIDDSQQSSWKRRKDARPPEIIQAAKKILEEKGIKGLSMMKISKAAGVSEATLYKYFNDKNDLLNQVYIDWAEPFVKKMEMDIKDISDLHSSLLFIAIRYLEGMKSAPKLHVFWFRHLRWDNYVGSPIHEMNRRYSNLVKKIFIRGISNNEINNSTNFDIFRDQFLGGLEHIGIRKILAGRNINIGKVSSELINNLLTGISK